jgi:hypothetical protein
VLVDMKMQNGNRFVSKGYFFTLAIFHIKYVAET